ncbi:MAG: hypothetical protein H6672_12720 [Anaerolineaceae bacterium]|nr:hypothetical protein [Anaerolineaceae bacterium]
MLTKQAVKACFERNWMFRLAAHPRLWWVMFVGLPLAIFLTGLMFSALFQVQDAFTGNILAYAPFTISLFLLAYRWFERALPENLYKLYPALETDPETYLATIRQVADRWYNPLSASFLGGTLFIVLNIYDLQRIWGSEMTDWLGGNWVASAAPGFFAAYHGAMNIIVFPFLLGSGIAGIILSMVLAYRLIQFTIKLDYNRLLKFMSNLSVGVASWTMIPAAIILVMSLFFKPNQNLDIFITSILISSFASFILLSIFFMPIISIHQALLRSKHEKLGLYENALYDISCRIDRILEDICEDDEDNPAADADTAQKLEQFRKERGEIKALIDEVRGIPDWPISFQRAVPMFMTAITPTISTIVPNLIDLIR